MLEDALNHVLTPQEVERFVGYLRPLIEAGGGRQREAVVYLRASKASMVPA